MRWRASANPSRIEAETTSRVADRGFCSFAHLAIWRKTVFSPCFACTSGRIVDFTPNRPHAHPGEKRAAKACRDRVGCGAWACSISVVRVVQSPRNLSEWMTAEQYAACRRRIDRSANCVTQVGRPGFPTRTVTLVTTLLDAGAFYPWNGACEKLYGTRDGCGAEFGGT